MFNLNDTSGLREPSQTTAGSDHGTASYKTWAARVNEDAGSRPSEWTGLGQLCPETCLSISRTTVSVPDVVLGLIFIE